MLDLTLEHEAVETIGGYVLSRLNRAPELGDNVEIAGHTVEVTGVDGTRISTVRIHHRDDASAED